MSFLQGCVATQAEGSVSSLLLMQLLIDCKNDLTDIVIEIHIVATLNATPPKSDNSDDR
jgi:hypothetical protein